MTPRTEAGRALLARGHLWQCPCRIDAYTGTLSHCICAERICAIEDEACRVAASTLDHATNVLMPELRAARAEMARLRTALGWYGWHDVECPAVIHRTDEAPELCACGFRDIAPLAESDASQIAAPTPPSASKNAEAER